MSRRRNVNQNSREYETTKSEYNDIPERLEIYDTADGIDPVQFQEPKKKFPCKPVGFILLFMIAGSVCLALGILISSGYFDQKYQDRAWPLLILGIMMFIPGGYYGYIVLCILCRRDGFTYDDIPIF